MFQKTLSCLLLPDRTFLFEHMQDRSWILWVRIAEMNTCAVQLLITAVFAHCLQTAGFSCMGKLTGILRLQKRLNSEKVETLDFLVYIYSCNPDYHPFLPEDVCSSNLLNTCLFAALQICRLQSLPWRCRPFLQNCVKEMTRHNTTHGVASRV